MHKNKHKMEIAIELCIFELVMVKNLTILIFWAEFDQKWYFRPKT